MTWWSSPPNVIRFLQMILLLVLVGPGLTLIPPSFPSAGTAIGRRDALTAPAKAAAAILTGNGVWTPAAGGARAAEGEVAPPPPAVSAPAPAVVVPMEDPPPLLSLATPSSVDIPRVGYSLFKTPREQAERGTALALFAGVTHFDLATQYGSTPDVAKALGVYIGGGRRALLQGTLGNEKPELLELCDAAYRATKKRSKRGGQKVASAPPKGTTKKQQQWRRELFLSHKLSNSEQSTDPETVQSSVLAAMDTLEVDYLDLVSIHSPLTDAPRRLTTYRALLDLQRSGTLRLVGVCNYGMGPLEEIKAAGLPLPAVNQLELSPFNTHRKVVEWCDKHGVAVSCAAWSRLSSADGPTQQWDVLAQVAQSKGMTKAQLLVRWALQKGYLCVPRSTAASKIDRQAIVENSYGGVMQDGYRLSADEMNVLEGLNVDFQAGRLGRRDGWTDADVAGSNWDPTEFT